MDFLKSHFFFSYDSTKSLLIASGPHGFITFVDSDLYPVEAVELHKIFISALTPSFASNCTFNFEHSNSPATKQH